MQTATELSLALTPASVLLVVAVTADSASHPPWPLFSSPGLSPRIPRGLFTDTSEHIRFFTF